MSPVDVSIIIVNWNTKKLLYNCISSIYEHTGSVDCEIIVVDNASEDGSAEMIKTNYPGVILIENCENKGFAAGNNLGISIATGRYILLLNSDTLILNKAIEKAVSFADSNSTAAVIGCRVLNPDKTLQHTCFMFPSIVNLVFATTYLYKIFPRNRLLGRERMTWWSRDDVREVDVVSGCFMLVRQKAIEQVGVMDERFFMYGEETDWCFRFKQADWRIFLTPNAEIIHLGGASSKQAKLDMTLQLRGSILLFFEKHRSKLSYRLACLLMSLFFFLRVPYWLAQAILSKNTVNRRLQATKTYAAGAFKALLGWRALCIQK